MKKNRLFLASLIGLAAAGAVLILFIPRLFDAPDQGTVWTVAVLSLLVVVFVAGTIRWKTRLPSAENNT